MLRPLTKPVRCEVCEQSKHVRPRRAQRVISPCINRNPAPSILLITSQAERARDLNLSLPVNCCRSDVKSRNSVSIRRPYSLSRLRPWTQTAAKTFQFLVRPQLKNAVGCRYAATGNDLGILILRFGRRRCPAVRSCRAEGFVAADHGGPNKRSRVVQTKICAA